MKALKESAHFLITGAAWGFGFGTGIFFAFVLGTGIMSMIEGISL